MSHAFRFSVKFLLYFLKSLEGASKVSHSVHGRHPMSARRLGDVAKRYRPDHAPSMETIGFKYRRTAYCHFNVVRTVYSHDGSFDSQPRQVFRALITGNLSLKDASSRCGALHGSISHDLHAGCQCCWKAGKIVQSDFAYESCQFSIAQRDLLSSMVYCHWVWMS